MARQFDKQFKIDAIKYSEDHKELGLQGCASNMGISQQTLSCWKKELNEIGDISVDLRTIFLMRQRNLPILEAI